MLTHDTTATAEITAHAEEMNRYEEELLGKLVGQLDAEIVGELTEGGSPARLLKVVLPDGNPHVIKLLVDLPGAVDGHDLGSFRLKIKQIDKVRTENPELRHCYTDKTHEFHGPDWAAYTMPFYPNEDIAACLRAEEPRPDLFYRRLGEVLRRLIAYGYRKDRAATGSGNIAGVHADRLDRRFWLLGKYLPASMTEPERIVVNGRPCRHPQQLARLILSKPELTAGIGPRWLYYPVHGDLNTRNILITPTEGIVRTAPEGIRIIDPRGTLDLWDISYDVAKVLFSLSVWDGGLRKGFEITQPVADEPVFGLRFRGQPYPGYVAAASTFLDFLTEHAEFAELSQEDPGWRDRLLLGHAFHLLAEAACRLSDIKKRTNELTESDISPLELAAGHYLYGVLFLEDAVAQLESNGTIDPQSHLGLLPQAS